MIEEWTEEVEMVDVMNGASRWHVPVHNHGFVALLDVMPRRIPKDHTADFAIAQAARASTGLGSKGIQDDRSLIRYLMRKRHTSPFEMVELKFHCALPIFVARQWIRHRTANVNEMSGRYRVLPNRFFRPPMSDIRTQSRANKQGRDEFAGEQTAREFLAWLDKADTLYAEYEQFVDQGIARELARINIPVAIYTEWYWKIDLHNLLHFLSLRLDPLAQAEIRAYAQAMFEMLKRIVPITCEAFTDYRLEAVTLTRLEVEAIREGRAEIQTASKREGAEWREKKTLLGLT